MEEKLATNEHQMNTHKAALLVAYKLWFNRGNGLHEAMVSLGRVRHSGAGNA
jgi:hypothetical protein